MVDRSVERSGGYRQVLDLFDRPVLVVDPERFTVVDTDGPVATLLGTGTDLGGTPLGTALGEADRVVDAGDVPAFLDRVVDASDPVGTEWRLGTAGDDPKSGGKTRPVAVEGRSLAVGGETWLFVSLDASDVAEDPHHPPVGQLCIDGQGVVTAVEGRAFDPADGTAGVGHTVFELFDDWPELLSAVDRGLAGETVRTTVDRDDAVFRLWVTPTVDGADAVERVTCSAMEVTETERTYDRVGRLDEAVQSVLDADAESGVVAALADGAASVFDEPFGVVWTADREAGRLRSVAMTERTRWLAGHPEDPLIHPRGGTLWTCFDRDEPTVVGDADADESPLGVPAQSVLCVPVGDYGLLTVGSPQRAAFDDVDADVAAALAATAAGTLERLARDRRERAERGIATVAEHSPVGLFALDDSGVVTRVAGRLFDVPELAADSLVGSDLADRFADQPAVADAIADSLDGTSARVAVEVGDRRLDAWLRPVLEDGTTSWVAGVTVDVTDRSHQHRRMSLLGDALGEVLYADSDAEVARAVLDVLAGVFENPIAGMWRYDPDEEVLAPLALTKGARAVAGPDAFVFGDDSVSMAAFEHGETSLVTADGVVADTRLRGDHPVASVLFVPVGDQGLLTLTLPAGAALTEADRDFVDVLAAAAEVATDHVERESRLDMLNEVVERATIGILVVDPTEDGSPVVYCNDGFEKLTGYDTEEVVGREWQFLRGPETDDADQERLREAVAEGQARSVEVVHHRADGTPFWNQVDLNPIADDDGDLSYVLQFHRNVTDRRRRKQQTQVLNRVLRHNLRNDLTVMSGFANLVQQSFDEDDPEYDRLGSIKERGDALNDLVDKVRRSLERVDPDSRELVSMATLVTNLSSDVAREYPDADVRVRFTGGDYLVDRTLELAVREAIENAIEHHDDETPEVTVSVDEMREGSVDLRIVDEGPGIPEVERDAIDAGEETPLNHASSIGLWLISWTVTSLGGSLTIEDNDPRGTIVRLHVPVSNTRPEPTSSLTTGTGGPGDGGRRPP